jgi:hypothetical protein
MELLPAWVLELLGGVEPLGLYSLKTTIFEQKSHPLKINTRLHLILTTDPEAIPCLIPSPTMLSSVVGHLHYHDPVNVLGILFTRKSLKYVKGKDGT